MIFKTKRLIIRYLDKNDEALFFDLHGNPNVMNAIPVAAFSLSESNKMLDELIARGQDLVGRKVWAIDFEGEFIGLCGLVFNDDNQNELLYRIREKFWGNGLGVEVAEGVITFGFQKLNMSYISADVDVENIKSSRILDKYFIVEKEFVNHSMKCIDRRYGITKKDWLKRLAK